MNQPFFPNFRSFLIGGFCFLGLLSFAHSANSTKPTGLELRVDPPYFSPNGDDLQDQVFFHPVLNAQKDVTRWRLEIRTSNRKKVNRLSGAGFPALIKWDGTDRKGRLVEDGEFSALLRIWGRGFKISSEPKFLVADTAAPEVEIAVSTPVLNSTVLDEKSFYLTPKVLDASPLERWALKIVDQDEKIVRVWWSTGPFHPLPWDGSDEINGIVVPPGNYRGIFQAWDKAGNESLPVADGFTVDVKPSESLSSALEHIAPKITEIGMIVQLKSGDLFTLVDGKPEFSEGAEPFLKEVAILINAYPDVPVRIDGYSWRLKSSSRDRDRSSHYAWNVYSYLVKKGDVKASRLTVRGRGRHANFDRRSVPVAVIKNGVEIMLEGDREW